jgi:hypothetical protein
MNNPLALCERAVWIPMISVGFMIEQTWSPNPWYRIGFFSHTSMQGARTASNGTNRQKTTYFALIDGETPKLCHMTNNKAGI